MKDRYPFLLPFIQNDSFDLDFVQPLTILVGPNGGGKSTVLEIVAASAGFNAEGGSASNRFGASQGQDLLDYLRLSWLPKIRRGFFFRAESFFNFATYIDEIAREDPEVWEGYGGGSLHVQSHGESFLALFENRFKSSSESLFLFDEPEAALSPQSQLVFLSILKNLIGRNNQCIMATHSPLLMAYPDSQVLQIEGARIQPIDFKLTDHFLLWREFVKRPEDFIAEVLETRDESESSGPKP